MRIQHATQAKPMRHTDAGKRRRQAEERRAKQSRKSRGGKVPKTRNEIRRAKYAGLAGK